MFINDSCILQIFQVVSEEEDVTREERQEEFDFLDACVDTRVMEIAHQFLVSKGVLFFQMVIDDPQEAN